MEQKIISDIIKDRVTDNTRIMTYHKAYIRDNDMEIERLNNLISLFQKQRYLTDSDSAIIRKLYTKINELESTNDRLKIELQMYNEELQFLNKLLEATK